jgi:3-deoxy-7-phosphoheptulonate synthase
MKRNASEAEVGHMVERVEGLGLKAHVLRGVERTVIAAIGAERDGLKESLESGTGVSEVLPILAPYKVASRELKSETTVVRARDLEVGGDRIGIIAGPCSVESEEQILAAARDATGLAVVTEVLATEDVELVARYADVLQIGARNMQNYRLLEAVGKVPQPVLLKRGPSATMEELLLAAEYILDAGNPNVMLCERGIRTFESHTRFTLPLATVPYLHGKTHLPVVVDPSHGTGHTWLVPQMACASVAAGADGLILEVHPDPENAMSDGYQSLNIEQFQHTLDLCRKVATALGKKL